MSSTTASPAEVRASIASILPTSPEGVVRAAASSRSDLAAALSSVQRARLARDTRESLHPFIMRKREILRLELSLEAKRCEIRKLHSAAAARTSALESAELQLEEESLRFEAFLTASDAAERAAAQAKVRELMVASLRPSTKLELVAEVCCEAPAAVSVAPVLAKVCLGDAVRARKEAEAAAEAAALRAEVQAMFSAPLGGILHAKPKAPQFKQSFAASAKKGAVAAKLEVVDEFTVRVNGVLKRIEAVEGTELARAQAVIRRQIADDAAKAKKSSRDKAYAQWEADKAAADADPTGWDVEDWVEPE